MQMNNRFGWPPLRTDYLIALCSAIVLFCLVFNRVLWFAPIALAGAIFCGVSPRMSGPFSFSVGDFRMEGKLGEGYETIMSFRARARPRSPDEMAQGQASSRGQPED
jgi:hypothetical protein